jgi:creatinine amidohydrolase
MMLAIAPHLVDMGAAKNFPNRASIMAEGNRILRAEGSAAFAWQAQDLNRNGATGNAANADAERGSAMLDHLAAQLGKALDELAAFPLSDLEDGPK